MAAHCCGTVTAAFLHTPVPPAPAAPSGLRVSGSGREKKKQQSSSISFTDVDQGRPSSPCRRSRLIVRAVSRDLTRVHAAPQLPWRNPPTCSEKTRDSSTRIGSGIRLIARIGDVSASASSAAVEEIAESEESTLIDALLAVGGRGRGASPRQLQDVQEAVNALEAAGGVKDPTSSPLIEGRWRLMFTTRPGTASPIQRTFVGIDAFNVFQDITLINTDDPRVSNIVRFSEAIGELKVEAAASRVSGTRVLFRFDKAAFTFKFLPFKVPYPVPFRLLGEEAKGWLDTTYLSPSGNIRISKGSKGTTFVLQKNLGPRQQLLQAIGSGKDIEKAMEQLIELNTSKTPTDFNGLIGNWRLIWTSQAENVNWIQRSTVGFSNWQIYAGNERLQNLVEFLPFLRLRAEAQTTINSAEQQGVKIEGATIELGSLRIPVNITGEGYVDILYLDSKLKISRGNKGSIFVHVRDPESR